MRPRRKFASGVGTDAQQSARSACLRSPERMVGDDDDRSGSRDPGEIGVADAQAYSETIEDPGEGLAGDARRQVAVDPVELARPRARSRA
jgi:hypothetical protein